jgi:ABC-type iron transport system FetAB permease component
MPSPNSASSFVFVHHQKSGRGVVSLYPMSLGLSALVQVCAQTPKSLKQTDETALGVEHLAASPAKTARNPLRNSLRKSLLPIAQLAAPHNQLRSSSPAKMHLAASPAKTARNPLRNSLRKSLLPIAQLAAPHNQLRSSSPATLPLKGKRFSGRPSGQTAPGG